MESSESESSNSSPSRESSLDGNWNCNRKESPDNSDNIPPYSRIFVICSKTSTEEELKEHFSPFGVIQ